MKLTPFQLERYFARYEFTAKYLLSSSDCESVTIQDLLALEQEAEERFRRHWLGYTESPGSLALREAICRIYTTVQPEDILVHSGAEEAIFLFMHAVLEPGDHIVVHTPAYQSLFEVALGIGAEVSKWQAREECNWELDLDDLKNRQRDEIVCPLALCVFRHPAPRS